MIFHSSQLSIHKFTTKAFRNFRRAQFPSLRFGFCYSMIEFRANLHVTQKKFLFFGFPFHLHYTSATLGQLKNRRFVSGVLGTR